MSDTTLQDLIQRLETAIARSSYSADNLNYALHGLTLADGWQIVSALRECSSSRPPAQWEPIETAPKDGTEIVALVSGHPYIVAWGTHGKAHAEPWWRDREGYGLTETTHWIAIPSARRV